MDNEIVLLQIMAAFTGVAAIALLVQMASLIGICLTIRRLKMRVNTFLGRWEPLAADAQKTLEEVSRESTEILKQVRELTVAAKSQIDKVDATIDALSKTTQLQAQKVDQTVQVLLERAQQTSLALQEALLTPVKQIRAVGVGIAAMIDALAGRRRSSVDRATQDEEMFI